MIQIGERWRLIVSSDGQYVPQRKGSAEDLWWLWMDGGSDRPGPAAEALGNRIALDANAEELAALQTVLGAIHAEIAQALERAREVAE